jgi:[protein-PII] uridylyltransferase
MDSQPSLPAPALRLKAARADLFERARHGAVGGFAWEYTHLVDRYFEEHILELGDQPFLFTLVAVGGYGRGRLCPGSDVDILLLFNRRIPKNAEAFVKSLLFPLWDIGLDLGHGVRTVADCIALADKDYQVLASLLDARPLAGNAEVFERFRAAFKTKALKRQGRSFARSLSQHNGSRAVQYGDASGMLEPELKNGLGGLRDGQQVFWLVAVMAALGLPPLFLPEELARLRDDQAFLNRVRTALHLCAGRKTDRLFFDLQPRTARLMGFATHHGSPEDTGRAVEFFLSRLHQAMTRIKAMREALFQEVFPTQSAALPPQPSAPGIFLDARGVGLVPRPKPAPAAVLAAVLESARTGLPLTWAARRTIRDNLECIAAGLTNRPQTLDGLVEIFASPHSGPACDGLLETRLLPALIPEFGQVEHLIQFNDYHVHPVGRHTMATLARLAGFCFHGDSKTDTDAWAREIAARVPRYDILILAGFFHDLGKGNPDHSEAGAAIARQTLARFGLDQDTAQEVALLVRHHLLIPKAATRRDLSDERVASEVAATAGSPERLDALYLLGVADSMATGPRAWNSWSRSLFAELYFKARRLLLHGPLAEPDAARRIEAAREAVLQICTDLDREFVDAALRAMPPRAFLALDPAELADHVRLVRQLWDSVARDRLRDPSAPGGQGIALIEAGPGRAEGTCRLTIAALDRTGLFATMAGALALHGLNILAADLFTWADNTAVDVFTVSEPTDTLFMDEIWPRVARSIEQALTNRLDLAARLEQRRNSPLYKGNAAPRLRPIVTVDNQGSDFFTIVEVAAPDRIGFLHDMARTLSGHGLSIHLAKITTIKGRAADIFHVRDTTGAKLTDPERIEAVRRDLLRAAEPA